MDKREKRKKTEAGKEMNQRNLKGRVKKGVRGKGGVAD